jgi:hypothetical protein
MAGNSETNPGIQVSIHHAMEAPSDLVEARLGSDWTGMVSVEEYGRWSLYELKFDTGPAKEALLQALPFAIRHIIQSLRFSKYRRFDPSLLGYRWIEEQGREGPELDGDLVVLGLVPFPEEHIVAQTMSRYLSSPDVMTLRSLDGLHIEDLPVLKLHLKTLKETCLCAKCSNLGPHKFRSCGIDMFFTGFASICADILALSLFGCLGIPLLHLRSFPDGSAPFKQAIQSIITSGTFSYVKLSDLLHYTLELTGHEFPNDPRDPRLWVMSSFKGQVIYPTLYETLCYKKEGYLTLNSLPGLLRYKEDVYTRVLTRLDSTSTAGTGYLKDVFGATVTMPLNLVPNLRLV